MSGVSLIAPERLIPTSDLVEYEGRVRELQLDLLEFGRSSYKIARGEEYVHSKHQEVLAAHLEPVRSKQIMRLLVNLPPSCSKSMWINVLLVAWIWSVDPAYEVILYSNSERLLKENSERLKALVKSRWYQHYFPDAQIQRGSDAIYEWGLTAGGNITYATPSSGVSTGVHPDLILFEDPQNKDNAERRLARERVNDWYFETIGSRGIGKDSVHVVSQQRLHLRDLSGAIVEKYKQEVKDLGETEWVHLCMAMRFVPSLKMADTPWGKDWRTIEGQLLFPELMTDKRVKRLERTLSVKSAYAVETQLQQNPKHKKGKLFDVTKLRNVDEDNPLPLGGCDKYVRAWDRAYSDEESAGACYSAGVLIGWKRGYNDDDEGQFYILDVKRERLLLPDLEDLMEATISMDVEKYGYDKLVTCFEGEGGAGKAVTEAMLKRLRKHRIYAVRPKGSKGTRAEGLAGAINRRRVSIVRNQKWTPGFIEEYETFNPMVDSGFKDQADAGALAYLEIVDPSDPRYAHVGLVLAASGGDSVPSMGQWKPCNHPGCNRPGFEGRYCCAGCEAAHKTGHDVQHMPKCNGKNNDWRVSQM